VIRTGLCLALVCTGCVRYVPRPLDPASHPAEALRRDLRDSSMLAAVTRHAGAPEGNRWTDRQLAVAALRYRADLRRRRAEWRAATAAVRTAGERRGIGVQGDVERRVSGREEGSPWVVELGGLFTLELGGKRGARIQAARAGAALAEGRLLAAARAVAVEARRATAGLAHAIGTAADAREEVELLEAVHELERDRFVEAALAASELARTATDIQNARLSLAKAQHGVLSARAALAGALAVPIGVVEPLQPVLTEPGACASIGAAGAGRFVRDAFVRRDEIAVALSEYALAESRLRLEVARQYPDLELGPGFVWDQGVNRWALALALPALLGSRNRGAIGEAEAAREVAALRVAEVQDSVLADLERSLQRCRGAALELAAADSVVAAAGRLLRREQEAYERGETSRLEPARAELQLQRARRARRAAERQFALASIELERAAGGPPSAPGAPWPDPREEPEVPLPTKEAPPQ
jgi:cobalt-zinc-cadmium efflux system outer membrane protein